MSNDASVSACQEATKREVAPGFDPVIPDSSLLASIVHPSQSKTQLVSDNFSCVVVVVIYRAEVNLKSRGTQ